VRDAEGSRRRILAAAELAFSRKGFDASSLDDIARRAGVTKQLIVHHFGGKKDLYAVIHTLRVRANLALEKSAKGGLENLVASRYARLAADPDFIRFLVWECARNWDHELPGSPERRDTIKEQLNKLRRLQLDEEIRSDVYRVRQHVDEMVIDEYFGHLLKVEAIRYDAPTSERDRVIRFHRGSDRPNK